MGYLYYVCTKKKKMNKKRVLILIFVLTNFIGFSQKTDSANLILSISEEQELNFYNYQPRLILKATLNTITEAKNEFPEQLMHSILSAKNQEWVNYNTLGGEGRKKEQSHYDK